MPIDEHGNWYKPSARDIKPKNNIIKLRCNYDNRDFIDMNYSGGYLMIDLFIDGYDKGGITLNEKSAKELRRFLKAYLQ